jgi:hypothetical protein
MAIAKQFAWPLVISVPRDAGHVAALCELLLRRLSLPARDLFGDCATRDVAASGPQVLPVTPAIAAQV